VHCRSLGDPAYEPFWTACEGSGTAVSIHALAHTQLPTAGADRFESRFALHACAHPLEQMMALLALIEGGVLERHPRLRVGLLEAGSGWLPYWLWRLDEVEYRNLAGEVSARVRMEPSAYFRRQCFVSYEPGEPCLDETLKRAGEDTLIFGTDFPHLEYDAGVVSRALGLREQLGERAVRKLLWDNPARFYGLSDG
jgi:predicted TIM-barrel fold metal-dependent hydrolase